MNVNSANMFNTLFIKTVKNTNKPIGTDGNNKPNFECIKCYEILLKVNSFDYQTAAALAQLARVSKYTFKLK